MSVQAPGAVVLIRPHHFAPNSETADDNVFQTVDAARTIERDRATPRYADADRLAEALEGAGITVHLFDDEEETRPDSVFPNNWFSTHAGGRIAVYPMYAPNRRLERRTDVLELLKARYRVQEIVDYSGLEADGLFLEGTGAMVLDNLNRTAYAVRSHRADPIVLERFCTAFGYEPMVFDAELRGRADLSHQRDDVHRHRVRPGRPRRDDAAAATRSPSGWPSRGARCIALTTEQLEDFAGQRDRAARHAGAGARAVGARRRVADDRAARRDRAQRPHPARRRLDDRARGRLGALHDRRHPPRQAPARRASADPGNPGRALPPRGCR